MPEFKTHLPEPAKPFEKPLATGKPGHLPFIFSRFIASQCAVCHSWPAAPVCQPCQTRFMPEVLRCSRCALPMPALHQLRLPAPALSPLPLPVCTPCRIRPPLLDQTLAAVSYAYPWSGLMADFKFGGNPGWAGFFAGLLLQTPGVTEALDSLHQDDWLLPLPLSAERLRQRGFNQSWEITRSLATLSQTRARLDAQLLLRVRHDPPQNELPRAARLVNVEQAYAVEPLRVRQLQGRRVLLVDDVMTTGASLQAAAQVLRKAGVAQITALVVARTAPQD